MTKDKVGKTKYCDISDETCKIRDANLIGGRVIIMKRAIIPLK
jgi:hypothetical protein